MIHVDWKSVRQKLTPDKRDLPPMGMRMYIGPQGHGKSLSMVHDAWEIKRKYPNMKVITNMDISFADEKFKGTIGLKKAMKINNGEKGVLLVVDELQLFASKKQGIPYEVFQGLCQQRKKRRFLMGTAQDWEDVDVSARKKVAEVVKVRRFWKFQYNELFDGYSIKYDQKAGEWVCKSKGAWIFKHNDELYNMYDTYAEISTNDELIEKTSTTLPQALAVVARPVEKSKRRR